MRLTCPACAATGSIEFFLMDASARSAVMAAFKLPSPLAQQVMVYISLFRPPKRGLTWDRVEKLLNELMEPINSAQLTRNGMTFPAPAEYWKEALDQMLMQRNKLTLPLKSHGYLFEIVANLANKAAGARELKKEQAMSYRHSRNSMPAPQSVSGIMEKTKLTERAVKDEIAAMRQVLKSKPHSGEENDVKENTFNS